MIARIVVAALALSVAGAAFATTPPKAGPATGEPVPRFESLAVDKAFGRQGPGRDHKITWLYQRRGLPVQVVEETPDWRRVIDPAGDSVWLHASRLSARRTAIVSNAPRTGAPLVSAPRAEARVLAFVAPGVVGQLGGCVGPWRELILDDVRGWIDADALWGAPDCASGGGAAR